MDQPKQPQVQVEIRMRFIAYAMVRVFALIERRGWIIQLIQMGTQEHTTCISLTVTHVRATAIELEGRANLLLNQICRDIDVLFATVKRIEE